MSWNFRVTKKTINGEILYGVSEVYYNKDGSVSGWVEKWRDPNGWGDKEDLRITLQNMLDALDREEFVPNETN